MMNRLLRVKISKAFLLAFVLALLIPATGRGGSAKIAVLPWKVNSAEPMDFVKSAMVDMLSTRLGAAGAELVRNDIVKAAVTEKSGEASDAYAVDIGKRLKADYVLYGSLTILGSAVSLDARLVEVEKGTVTPFASKATGIDSIIGLTEKLSAEVVATLNPPKAEAPVKAEAVKPQATLPVPSVAPAPAPAKEAKGDDGFIVKPREEQRPVAWKSRDFDGMYVAMTAADLDKDGVKEVFLASRTNIVVAAYGPEGLKVLKEFRDTGADNIAMTAIDSDKDGSMEVYVSRVADNRAASAVIEYRDKDYRITAKGLSWLLRTVRVGDAEPVLAGQRFRQPDGFYGGLKVLSKAGDGLVEKGGLPVELPAKVDIYRFDAFDFTGKDDLVAMDERGYLKLFTRDGNAQRDALWKSEDYYGGTLNKIELRDDRPGAEPRQFPVEGGLLHADLDRDGKFELLVKKNTPGGLGRSAERPASFKTGEIISLSWDSSGGATAENWRTKQVEGYIADFLIDDMDGDGLAEAVMLVVGGTEGLFRGKKSYVLSHRISL